MESGDLQYQYPDPADIFAVTPAETNLIAPINLFVPKDRNNAQAKINKNKENEADTTKTDDDERKKPRKSRSENGEQAII